MVIKTHKDLDVWKLSMQFVTTVYQLTDTFPDTEKFGLTSQLRRAAVSIPSNIAEGAGRASNREFSNFLSITMGSLAEVETQHIIATNLGYLNQEKCDDLLTQSTTILRMVGSLRKKIKEKV